MPKMKGISKSEMIREMLRQEGMDASPTEVARTLTAQGHKVTPNLVSGIKISMKKKGKGKGKRRSAMIATTQPADGNHPSINDVYQVWALANRIGNSKLKQIVRGMP